ncbi:Riboflavin synthase [Senna tora]|uniref:Riboflavin synthase n=1 Tax=Senna tora TaxID=362788 RepID=A0A834TSB5_9FABA|nr:Riboflavin synthase [Senna tora]
MKMWTAISSPQPTGSVQLLTVCGIKKHLFNLLVKTTPFESLGPKSLDVIHPQACTTILLILGVNALSKLTSDPGSNSINEVFLSVSGDNPTVKSDSSVSKSVTVRHVPLTAILSPRFTPPRTVVAAIFKSNPPSSVVPICLIEPISSTMPVKRHLTVLWRWVMGLVVGMKAWRMDGLVMRLNLTPNLDELLWRLRKLCIGRIVGVLDDRGRNLEAAIFWFFDSEL